MTSANSSVKIVESKTINEGQIVVNTVVSLHSPKSTVFVRTNIVCIPQIVEKTESCVRRLGYQLVVFCLVGWFVLFFPIRYILVQINILMLCGFCWTLIIHQGQWLLHDRLFNLHYFFDWNNNILYHPSSLKCDFALNCFNVLALDSDSSS